MWCLKELILLPLRKAQDMRVVTPLPGEEGRCTISGHRTTYGAPFNRVDELERRRPYIPGDPG